MNCEHHKLRNHGTRNICHDCDVDLGQKPTGRTGLRIENHTWTDPGKPWHLIDFSLWNNMPTPAPGGLIGRFTTEQEARTALSDLEACQT